MHSSLSALLIAAIAAHASGQDYVADLIGASEVPPSGSTATGAGAFQLNPDGSVTYDVTAAGLSGIGAHLHLAPAGSNGPAIATLSGGPIAWSGTTAPLSPAELAALSTGGIYVNVHTNQIPTGEIRGQLQGQFTVFGLPHTTVGHATATKGPTGSLLVSNLGSSGCDGVSIDLGDTDYHTITFETAGAATLPTGAYMEVTSVGELNGIPDQDIWALRVEDVGSQYALSIDTKSVMPGTFELRLRQNGSVVAAFPMNPPQAGQPLAVFLPEGCFMDPVWIMDQEIWAMVALAGTGPVTVPGQAPMMADEIVLVAGSPGASVGPLSSTRMQAADMISFTLVTEQLGMFGNGHTTIDDAVVEGTGGKLKISNLGSSGCDGVSIDLGDTDSADITLEALSLSQGATVTLSSIGSFNGIANSKLGKAVLRDNGASVDAVADFAPLGATQVRVEVWSGNALQGIVLAPTGSVVASILPSQGNAPSLVGCGKLPPNPPCLILDLDDVYPVAVSGGSVFSGDQLRLLAADAIGTIDSLSSYSIQAGNVPELVITGESEKNVVAYGSGCAGSGGFVPELDLTGTIAAGSSVTLEVKNALGGSSAILFLGLGTASIPVGFGCQFLVAPVVTSFTVPLFGVGAGNGQFIAPVLLPASASSISFTLQAFCIDPGTALGAAASNGLKVSVE